jgi:hypothetical protein
MCIILTPKIRVAEVKNKHIWNNILPDENVNLFCHVFFSFSVIYRCV